MRGNHLSNIMGEVTGRKPIVAAVLFLGGLAAVGFLVPEFRPTWGVGVGALMLLFFWLHGAQHREVGERTRRRRP